MRFPEDRIKEAILHPDPELGSRAVSYFAKSSAPDPTVMPWVIRAVEAHGRQQAYRLIGPARDLPQTADTVAWVIDELNDERAGGYENYAYNLSMVLVQADPALLLPREADVLGARHFCPDERAAFTERLRLLSWDAAACWRELEAFCEAAKDKQDVNEVDLGHAFRVVEALARFGRECEAKVLDLLSRKVEDFRNDPMVWQEPLAVRLAGEARLQAALPHLITKLRADEGDLLNEECARALTRLGTPEVLEAVAAVYPGAEDHFRIYATEPLEQIHSDLAVAKSRELLGREKDRGIQMRLAEALLAQFAPEGVEAARRLLVGRELDFAGRGLRNYLLETCAITGERFPEYDDWLATEEAEKAEHRRRVNELKDDPQGLLLYALEKLAGKKAPAAPRPAVPPAPVLTLPRKPADRGKVGRNDPCPCGSGKKFKNCCLKKQR